MRRLDGLLVAGVVVVAGAAAVDAVHRRGGSSRTPTAVASVTPPAAAPVPALVRLVPSTTAFLPRCATSHVALTVGPAPQVTLHYRGGRCHLPPLGLVAVVRDAHDDVVYRGAATAHDALAGNYAGAGTATASLVTPCRGGTLEATVRGAGLAARGRIRCP